MFDVHILFFGKFGENRLILYIRSKPKISRSGDNAWFIVDEVEKKWYLETICMLNFKKFLIWL